MVRSASARDIFAAARALRATLSRRSRLPESESTIAAESETPRLTTHGVHTAPLWLHDAWLGTYVNALPRLALTTGLPPGGAPAILTAPSAFLTEASAMSRSRPRARKMRSASSSASTDGSSMEGG